MKNYKRKEFNMQKKTDNGIISYPMPVAIIGTIQNDKCNFMTAAWLSMVSHTPPRIALTLGKHLTTNTINETGVFSICFPSAKNIKETDYCGIISGTKADKSKLFTVFKGDNGAPLIEECGLNVECLLHHTDINGLNTTFIADIIGVYEDENILIDGKIDFIKLNPLILNQSSSEYYTLNSHISGKAWNIGKNLI